MDCLCPGSAKRVAFGSRARQKLLALQGADRGHPPRRQPTAASAFLYGTKGSDCNTLARAIEALAEDCLGVPAQYKTSADVGFGARFVVPKATTIDGQTGNVDDGASWQFANHGWIEPLGVKFDVLFGNVGVDSGGWSADTGSGDSPAEFRKTGIWPTGKVTPISARYCTQEI